jgi:hypothetical protein
VGQQWSRTPSPPVTLFKFGNPEKGEAPVELVDELTPEWLSAKIKLTRGQIIKVKDCAEVRGHKWLA